MFFVLINQVNLRKVNYDGSLVSVVTIFNITNILLAVFFCETQISFGDLIPKYPSYI